MYVTASFAIAWIESGVLPVDAPTPRLSKAMTRCLAAIPSTTRGVPVVEGPSQMHEEDDRDTGLRAELAVGVIHATGRDGSGRCVPPRRVHAALGLSVVVHVGICLLGYRTGCCHLATPLTFKL